MLTPQLKETIRQMHQKQIAIRKIAEMLGVSRNTVRKVLRHDDVPSPKQSKYEDYLEVIKELMFRCRGNLVRVQECLKEEYDFLIPYTSLTWMVL